MNQVLDILKGILKKDTISLSDNFFEIGGSSIKALILVSEIEKICNISLMISEIYEQKYIGNILSLIESKEGNNNKEKVGNILYFNSFEIKKRNMFFIPPVVGTSLIYNKLATIIDSDFNCIGLEYPGFHDENEIVDTFQEIVSILFNEIKKIQDKGEFFIFGYSMGGLIGFEITKIIENELKCKTNLVLVDSAPKSMFYNNHEEISASNVIQQIINAYKDILSSLKLKYYQTFLLNNINLIKDYSASSAIKGSIISFEAKNGCYNMSEWRKYTSGNFKNEIITGDHFEIIKNIDLHKFIL